MTVTAEFRELQRAWYAKGASNALALPAAEVKDDYYRAKLEAGLITRSADYTADWRVETSEYSVATERFGSDDVRVISLSELNEDEDEAFDLEELALEECNDDPEDFVSVVSEIAGLSQRERQVIRWIAEGNSVTNDYAERLASALGTSVDSVKSAKKRALAKLREHWANDMEAQGLVDPRYLNPLQADEYVCPSCHLIRHQSQRQESGVCIECTS